MLFGSWNIWLIKPIITCILTDRRWVNTSTSKTSTWVWLHIHTWQRQLQPSWEQRANRLLCCHCLAKVHGPTEFTNAVYFSILEAGRISSLLSDCCGELAISRKKKKDRQSKKHRRQPSSPRELHFSKTVMLSYCSNVAFLTNLIKFCPQSYFDFPHETTFWGRVGR